MRRTKMKSPRTIKESYKITVRHLVKAIVDPWQVNQSLPQSRVATSNRLRAFLNALPDPIQKISKRGFLTVRAVKTLVLDTATTGRAISGSEQSYVWRRVYSLGTPAVLELTSNGHSRLMHKVLTAKIPQDK